MKWNEPICFPAHWKRYQFFPSLSPENSNAVSDTLVLQGLFYILASLVLDGGLLGNWVLVATMVWWIGFLFILIRRPRTEDRGDKIFLKLGFLILLFGFPLLFLALASIPIWGWLRR